jgi:hypothetical protein
MVLKPIPDPRIKRLGRLGDAYAESMMTPYQIPPHNPYMRASFAGALRPVAAGLMARQADVRSANIEARQRAALAMALDPKYAPVQRPPGGMPGTVAPPRPGFLQGVGRALFPRHTDPAALQRELGGLPQGQLATIGGITPSAAEEARRAKGLKGQLVTIVRRDDPERRRSIHTSDPDLRAMLTEEGGWVHITEEDVPGLMTDVKTGRNIGKQYLDAHTNYENVVHVANQVLRRIYDEGFTGGLSGKALKGIFGLREQALNLFDLFDRDEERRRLHARNPEDERYRPEDRGLLDPATYRAVKNDEGRVYDVWARAGITNAAAQAALVNLAYMLAKSADPGGRLSDRDIALFLDTVGAPSGSADLIAELVGDRVDAVRNNVEVLYRQARGFKVNADLNEIPLTPYDWNADGGFRQPGADLAPLTAALDNVRAIKEAGNWNVDQADEAGANIARLIRGFIDAGGSEEEVRALLASYGFEF